MNLQLTNEIKEILKSGANLVKGAARRVYMASVVAQMGKGGQRRAAEELGWNRDVIRKGKHELRSGFVCVDAFGSRGRKSWEEHQPDLDKDIREIANAASQTDPTFRTTQLYRRLTAGELRRQLLEEKGYRLDQIPSERTLCRKLTEKGFPPRKVAKSKPKRKIVVSRNNPPSNSKNNSLGQQLDFPNYFLFIRMKVRLLQKGVWPVFGV